MFMYNDVTTSYGIYLQKFVVYFILIFIVNVQHWFAIFTTYAGKLGL